MLPTGRILGRITQKGQTNLRPIFGSFCTGRAEKGPTFWKVCFPTLLLSNYGPKTIILFLLSYCRQRWFCFYRHNAFKKGKLLGSWIFSSAAEFFRRTDRKSVSRVGNTENQRDGWLILCIGKIELWLSMKLVATHTHTPSHTRLWVKRQIGESRAWIENENR